RWRRAELPEYVIATRSKETGAVCGPRFFCFYGAILCRVQAADRRLEGDTHMMSSDAARMKKGPVLRAARGVALAALMAALGGCAGTDGFSVFQKERADTPYGAYLAGRHAFAVN